MTQPSSSSLLVSMSTPLHLLSSGASYALLFGQSIYSCAFKQCCCLSVVALEIKWKAPKAHTLLELVYVRWGKVAHVVSPCLLSRCFMHSSEMILDFGYKASVCI